MSTPETGGRIWRRLRTSLTQSGLLVLNYHRIGDPGSSPLDHGLWSASEDAFGEQVRLCKRHLDLISAEDLPTVIRRRGLYGLITFDDGYRDNFEVAFPILAAERVSATFFITTQFVDAPQMAWWDRIAYMVRTTRHTRIELPAWLKAPLIFDEPEREMAVRTLLRAYKLLPHEQTSAYLAAIATATDASSTGIDASDQWLTWDMLRAMRKGGMVIGGHSLTHPVLAQMPRDQQRVEILGCAERIATQMGEPMHYFSYPVGGRKSFDSTTLECLREAGVRHAFSYYGGYRRFSDWNDYDIRRVPVETELTLKTLRRIVSFPQIFA